VHNHKFILARKWKSRDDHRFYGMVARYYSGILEQNNKRFITFERKESNYQHKQPTSSPGVGEHINWKSKAVQV
jgi:hypothetical protein